jgi:hypothetical protein
MCGQQRGGAVRRLFILAVVLLVACALAPAGCDGSKTEGAVPSEWVTFETDWITLRLPDSFRGGDPLDPEVMAVLEEVAAHNPDPSAAANWQAYLEGLKVDLESGAGLQLMMWGEPNAEGRMPMVDVSRTRLPDGQSLEEWMESVGDGYPDPEVTVETLADDRAYMVLRTEGWGLPLVAHIVAIKVGPTLYQVFYALDDPSNTALDLIFRTSARTIVVRGSEEGLPRSQADKIGLVRKQP